MNELEQLLVAIVDRRPEGESRRSTPLYRYRPSAEEFVRLRDLLRARLARWGSLSDRECAAFCLFASVHTCREYDGGPWSWDHVRDDLELRGQITVIHDIVERGLRWFGRTLWKVTQTEYLATIVGEGGLPTRALSGGGRWRDYLRAVLLTSESHRRPALEYASEFVDMLAARYRTPVLVRLAADLVDAVVSIRDRIPTDVDDPIAWLNTHEPGWRANLPVALDDAAVSALLRGLLVVRLPPASRIAEPSVALSLWLGESPRVHRTILLPADWAADAVATRCGVAERDLPGRLYLDAIPEGESPRAVAALTQSGDKFRVEALPLAQDLGPHALGRVLLVLRGGRGERTTWQPPGGEELRSVPWVFGDELDAGGGAPAFIGTGSIASRSAQLLIAVPSDAHVRSADSSPDLPLHERGTFDGRTWWQISGRVLVEVSGETFQIRSAAPVTELTERYELVGDVLSFGDASPVWRGTPRVFASADNGVRREVAAERLHVSAQGKVMSVASAIGPVSISVRDGAITTFRTRVTVIPRDLEVRLVARSNGPSEIEVRGASLVRAALWDAPHVACETLPAKPGEVRLRVTAKSPPVRVELDLELQGGRHVRLVVPYPCTMSRFVDGGERVLCADAVLDRDHLHGVRALAWSTSPNARFSLQVKGGEGWQTLTELPLDSNQRVEFPLILVKDLIADALAWSGELDARVQLRIVQDGGALVAGAVVSVGQWSRRLSWDRARSELRLTSASGDGRDLVTVEAVSVAHPASPAVTVEAISGGWRWVPPPEPTGPWIVAGRVSGQLMTRPLLVHGAARLGASDSLDGAIDIQDRGARAAALGSVLAHAATDANDPVWPRVREYLDVLDRFPASTFDVLRALTQTPDAAALAALMAPTMPKLADTWRGLEELPFLWTTVPLRSWVRAAVCVNRWVEANVAALSAVLGSREQILTSVLDPFVQFSRRGGPKFMCVLLDAFAQRLDGFPRCAPQSMISALGAPARSAVVDHLVRVELQALRSRVISGWSRPSLPTHPGFLRFEDWARDTYALVPAYSFLFDGRQPVGDGSVFFAPLFAAWASCNGEPLGAPMVAALRRARSFAPAYFDTAHAIAFAAVISDQLKRNGNALHEL